MPLTELFQADLATTTVSSGGTDAPSSGTSETLTVASSSMFGAAATGVSQFHFVDVASGKQSEVFACTNVSGTTWTVTRGAESTTPLTHTTGFTIQQVFTSGWLTTVAQLAGDLGATNPPEVVSTHLAVTTNASATGTVNLDPTSTRVFHVTETGATTFTFTGSSLASGTLYSFTLFLNQDATGGRTTTWPGSVTWIGGTAPTLNTAASALNLLVFETFNGGSTWYGALVQAVPSGQFLATPVQYKPGSPATYTVSTSGMVPLDTTNLIVTFTAPASGSVLIRLSAFVIDASGGSACWFGLTNASGGVVTGPTVCVISSTMAGCGLTLTSDHYVGGLTAGTSYTLQWAAACSAATTEVVAGLNGGSTSTLPSQGCAPACMTVQAV